MRLTADQNPRLLEQLKTASTRVGELVSAFDRLGTNEGKIAEAQMNKLTTNLGELAQTAIGPYEQTTTLVQPHHTQSLVIPSLDAAGHAIFTIVTLCTGAIDTTGVNLAVAVGYSEGASEREKEPCGKEQKRGEGLPAWDINRAWRATVKAIQNHWYGGWSALVTLSPEPPKAPDPGTAVARTQSDH